MTLCADQRQDLYQREAARTGLHQPLLAALYEVQQRPSLADGEKGLGIVPAPGVPLPQVETLPGQVHFAANTLQSLSDRLVQDGWQGKDFWNPGDAAQLEGGGYSDRFLSKVAEGFQPNSLERGAAQLESCDGQHLKQVYWRIHKHSGQTNFAQKNSVDSAPIPLRSLDFAPSDRMPLDAVLLHWVDRLPRFYRGLGFQRQALLEGLRIWRKQPSITALLKELGNPAESALEGILLPIVSDFSRTYTGYPYQREALLRLVQAWGQLDSREAAIVSLAQNPTPCPQLSILDPALIAFVQQIPQTYRPTGDQRHALTEGFRLWHQLNSRPSTLVALGVDPSIFSQAEVSTRDFQQAAHQVDRSLLQFVDQIPYHYQESDRQRQALIHLVQLWRGLTTQAQAIDRLLRDVQRMATARRDLPEAAPVPLVPALPPSPDRWTPQNLHLYAPIVPQGRLIWAEATRGGTRIPQDSYTIEAIVRLATLAEQAQDRVGRPFRIIDWYCPYLAPENPKQRSNLRHSLGDAITFYVEGLTANQIYWALDPWWPGSLGRYRAYPALVYLDARPDRVRWCQDSEDSEFKVR